MARTVNIHEAKTHLSKLVQEAAAGEEIVIARAGDPLAKLVAYTKPRGPRQPGGWEGQVWIAPDFDELPADIATAFGMTED
jgi:prevent-host-death family protein